MTKIYISSTYSDLIEHRQQVYDILRKMRYDVIAMEDYVATDERPLDKCLADVTSCDIYVGIFAWRYGYIPPGQERSITELEYRQAGEAGLERLIFLLDEDAPWPRSKMESGAGGKKIEALRQKLMKDYLVQFFKSPEELVGQVAASVAKRAQAQLETSPSEPITISSVPRVPYQAPALPAHYIKRAQLKIVKQELMASNEPFALTILHGMGGAGKTTLATALTHDAEVVEHFKDGVLWAKLGPNALVENWQVTWGAALGDDLQAYPNPETKAVRLRTLLSDKCCLLVIDDIWSETDIEHLLVGGEHCRTLITTRQGVIIQRTGAETLDIDVLEEAEALKLLGNWAGRNLNKNSKARKLVGHLGNLPLAVTLAGAQLQDGATLDELLEIFRDEHGNLAHLDLEDPQTREHSLNLTFDLSVQRLNPKDQRNFAQLSVFAAGEPFDTEAVAAIWAEKDKKQVNKSLRLLTRHALLDKTATGYNLHPLLQKYALSLFDKLDKAGRTEAMGRHIAHYLNIAKRSTADWQATELALGQIRAVWQRVKNTENEQVFAFVDTMTPFFTKRGLLRDKIAWTERGLALTEKLGRHNDKIRYLNNIGDSYMRLGLWQEAEEYFVKALEKAEHNNNFLYQSWAVQYLGCLCRNRGDFPQAMLLYRRALALAERIGARQLISRIYNEIGTVYRMQGDYPQAITYYKKGLEIDHESENERGLATGYGNLGSVYLQQGDFEQAIFALNRALGFDTKIGEERGMAQTYCNLSILYTEQGKYNLAIETAQKGLEIMLRIGDQQGIADIYANFGNSYHKLGNNGQAVQTYQKALEIHERVGDEPSAARDYGNLGNVYQELGDVGQALAYYHKSLEITERIGDRHTSANQYFRLGKLYRDLGDMEQARSHYEKAKALFEIVGDMRLTQQVVQNLDNLYEYDYSVSKLFDKSGIVSQEHYKADLILDFLQKNLEFTLRQGDERRNANIYFNLGNLHCKLGDRDLARVHYEKAKALYQMVGDAQKAQVVAQALRGL